jgi:epoxyqueuosine reductase
MGNAVIGCDICQDVCPWNRRAPLTHQFAFEPRSFLPSDRIAADTDAPGSTNQSRSLLAPELRWLASLSQQEFSSIFRRSAAKRAKWRGMVRNACVALGNASLSRDSAEYARVIALLENLANSRDPLISEHAQWALARLTGNQVRILG